MNTEQPPSKPGTSAEHAALEHLCAHLAGVANTALERLEPRRAFDAFAATAIDIGLKAAGKAETLQWLTELADALREHEPAPMH